MSLQSVNTITPVRLPPESASAEAFAGLCRANPDDRIERTAQGEIEVMPPPGAETGHRNLELILQLGNWSKQDDQGVAFDASTGFVPPTGAVRSPDAAWVRRDRLTARSAEAKRGFPPLAPDFLIELASECDALEMLQGKMAEYQANGVRLGWLIAPKAQTVWVYAPGRKPRSKIAPQALTAAPLMPGFALNLGPIWRPGL